MHCASIRRITCSKSLILILYRSRETPVVNTRGPNAPCVCVFMLSAASSYYKSELMRDITSDLISLSNGTHPRINSVLFFMRCILIWRVPPPPPRAHVSLAFIEFLFSMLSCAPAGRPNYSKSKYFHLGVRTLFALYMQLRGGGSRACIPRHTHGHLSLLSK